jgi:dihydrodipicolinate reductase
LAALVPLVTAKDMAARYAWGRHEHHAREEGTDRKQSSRLQWSCPTAAGNFSVMAAILQHCALLAARHHLRSFEVIDCESDEKPDVPSGTSREVAERLGRVQSRRT